MDYSLKSKKNSWLKKNKYQTVVAGNIGIPVLGIKNKKRPTYYIIEASSYQLELVKELIYQQLELEVLNMERLDLKMETIM